MSVNINEATLNKIKAWLDNTENTPSYQGTYSLAEARSYYEQLCLIYKFLEQFKTAADDLDDRVEDLEDQIETMVKEIESTDTITATNDDGTYTLDVNVENIDIEDLLNYDAVSTRITTNTNNITDLTSHVDAIEDDIEELDGRLDTAETNITSLQTNKQNKLVAGQNITIDQTTNTISATGVVSTDWSNVTNQPQINAHSLASGNNTLDTLGIQATISDLTDIRDGATLGETSLQPSDIVDALTSSEANKVLSAKQGKVLQDSKVNTSDIVNNLTSTDTDKPLSANQGKVLKDLVDTKEPSDSTILKQANVVNNLTSSSTIYPLSANQGNVINTTGFFRRSAESRTSANDFKDVGFSLLNGSNITDLPASSSYYWLMVLSNSSQNVVLQFATRYSINMDLYMRKYQGDTWSNWVSVTLV